MRYETLHRALSENFTSGPDRAAVRHVWDLIARLPDNARGYDSQARKVREFIRTLDGRPFRIKEVALVTGASDWAARSAIQRLAAAGEVIRIAGGQGRRPALYREASYGPVIKPAPDPWADHAHPSRTNLP